MPRLNRKLKSFGYDQTQKKGEKAEEDGKDKWGEVGKWKEIEIVKKKKVKPNGHRDRRLFCVLLNMLMMMMCLGKQHAAVCQRRRDSSSQALKTFKRNGTICLHLVIGAYKCRALREQEQGVREGEQAAVKQSLRSVTRVGVKRES